MNTEQTSENIFMYIKVRACGVVVTNWGRFVTNLDNSCYYKPGQN